MYVYLHVQLFTYLGTKKWEINAAEKLSCQKKTK